jgi:galactitol-specific phosphotransferase system IIC component
MALGARPAQAMRTVLASGMALVGIGAVAGLIASQFTARLLQSLLFGVSTHDVAAYAAALAGVAAVGFPTNLHSSAARFPRGCHKRVALRMIIET